MAAPRESVQRAHHWGIYIIIHVSGRSGTSFQACRLASSMAPNRLHEDWKIFAVICAGGFISGDLILLELMGTPVRVINSNSKGGAKGGEGVAV